MNIHLQFIASTISQLEQLSETEKDNLLRAVKEADKTCTVLDFKLARALKENRTTSVLLEETIDELQQKSEVLAEANLSLTQMYENLKSAQSQLIQAEKMASLGELTAGIAHEIQNPLNFITNFSEVNTELIDELEEEIANENLDAVKAIADDLKNNEHKISFHGKRADAIVKGMLQHSRHGSGQKELTDINTLADEYLRLCYHGLRAKDKSFNADILTDWDKSVGSIKIISQDVGRVLLNLYNNAFYAMQQRQATDGADYKPTVEVSTAAENSRVLITVKDNGTGIPDHIKDKILQPFFTTKPAGQGTGLGLSLSYDIIVKGHGGKLNIESKADEGSVFTIVLPV